MLSDNHRAALLRAVPSFASTWRGQEIALQEERRSAETAAAAAELDHDLLWSLALHLGDRVAGGEIEEAGALFRALEPVYTGADDELWNQLTIGFMESLIHAIERGHGDASVLTPLAVTPEVAAAWRTAYAYITGPGSSP